MSAQLPWTGLSEVEARERLKRQGPNALPEKRPEPLWRRFLRQFKSPLIYILLFALAVDSGVWWLEGRHGWPLESLVIGLILLLNAGLGTWQERKSEAALNKLKRLSSPLVWVERDGAWVQRPSRELVPGDLVRLEAGDRVPADVEVLEGSPLVDESVLTGESLPAEKEVGEELFSGTLLVRGKAFARVQRTGPESALGKLATLLGEIKAEPTPLEHDLHHFGNQVARWVLVLAGALVLLGLFTEGAGRLPQVFLFAVALAVAAVPEGLPAVLTLTLSLGVERMAVRKAVVRKLSAVEALGSVTVIATDKTGTLTENRMEVRALDSPDPAQAQVALALANDADHGIGDPMDLALLHYLQRLDLDPEALRQQHPRLSERAFESGHKFQRVTVETPQGPVSYFKGAPEVLLGRSHLPAHEYQSWQEKALAYAAEGYRVLGVARGEGEAEENLQFLGLVLFWDPPRAEVPEAIRKAQEAGIRVLMVTGDHPATALAIAHQIGIPGERVITGSDLEKFSPQALLEAIREVNVFARVSPEHKLRLVEMLQSSGEVVAMTGDGVNDAPALKRSDVGVAMGQRGSDVSREVADLVLLDDNFATIVAAIEEGRNIYENIQKFIRFLFSTNLSEVLVVAIGALAAALLNLRDATGALLLPLTAVQILWINLITDGLPAISLTLDKNPSVMQHPPRPPKAPLLDRVSLRFVLVSGSIKALCALGLLGLLPRLGYSLEATRSATFHFMAIGQLFFAYPARHTHLFPLPNPWLHGAVLLGLAVQFLVGMLPASTLALDLVPLPLLLWGVLLGTALLAWGLAELTNRIFWHNHRDLPYTRQAIG
ncbi:cation-transporting P-type ATPase [Meiothermus sp.]|uniref:cation-translocating P-type ATPase n=1 Tax=Meiothermus sp. TaxID=1955249 RepID=UPI0021DF0EAB|nr:cation-transporting P-type ATPase [Meiothermus sp.]GIW34310.1 MAG: haloacid dehalogenase [Meiothermus sp.]